MKVYVKKLREDAELPRQKYADDYCYDVKAADVSYYCNTYTYYTGLAFEIRRPWYYRMFGWLFKNKICLELRSRSSIWETGLAMSNGLGTIDEGYRGESKGVFYHVNPCGKPYKKGERFAQLCLSNGKPIEWVLVDRLPSEGTRGEKGYGSTGLM